MRKFLNDLFLSCHAKSSQLLWKNYVAKKVQKQLQNREGLTRYHFMILYVCDE